jgi:hypothetical protein
MLMGRGKSLALALVIFVGLTVIMMNYHLLGSPKSEQQQVQAQAVPVVPMQRKLQYSKGVLEVCS